MNRQQARHLLARASLAVAFIGIGLWEIVQPSYWLGYVPQFLNFLPADYVLLAEGVVITSLGAAVLLGVYLKAVAGLSALMMLSVIASVIVSTGFTDIVIRDIALFLIAASLYFDDVAYLRLIG